MRLISVIFTLVLIFAGALFAQESNLPDSWRAEWAKPSNRMRPLQIVHGADLTNPATVEYYRDRCGLGGLVVNVGGKGYIRNQENWDRFVQGARNADRAGMRLWIYDELGYPSLMAGGVVLQGHPELVSKELVWDKDAKEPFVVRDCYEFTHSCNSYSTARRYPNPLEPAAVERFVEVTHERYRKELGEELYRKIEAFFTDEPSMMAANLGQLPESIRSKVKVEDPLDPNKKNLPMLPWCADMERQYKARYGQELRPHFISLFSGDTEADKQIRANYWALVTDLYSGRFYGTISQFCHKHPGPVSSGHTLHEGVLRGHVPLDGNKMRTLKSLDIPGIDMLTSNPLAHQYGGCTTPAFACSAATLIGQRRTMSEVSDHSERMAGKMATLDMMEATAAWHAAWGITDFTLYYGVKGDANATYRNEESHKAYCTFVGRLNAILADAVPVRPVLVYYPIETMQREFIPTAARVNDAKQSETMTAAVESFVRTVLGLCQAQIPLTIIDGESIRALDDGRLAEFTGLILPRDANPPTDVRQRIQKVWPGKTLDAPDALAQAAPSLAGTRLTGIGSKDLFQGVFTRDGRTIFLLVNLGTKPYQGTVGATFVRTKQPGDAKWLALNPQTGAVESFVPGKAENGAPNFPVTLAPHETRLFVTPLAK